MPLKHARRLPTATYRVQLHAGFDFAKLTALVPYLHALGISDVYCSPIFSAAPGSTHGYDVSDYFTINAELGGEAGFVALTDELKKHGMGLLLDFVPNHMGTSGPFNPWWHDVLECGQSSPYAQFFDIHWNGHRGGTRILVPMLQDHYGVVLERGDITLRYAEGSFSIVYGDTPFPVRPETYQGLLRETAARLPEGAARHELEQIADAFAELPKPRAEESREQKQPRADRLKQLKRQFADLLNRHPDLSGTLETWLKDFNGTPGQAESFNRLDQLIGHQNYRLAHWKTGAHETNYRRFFAIDSLIGLRMERDEVFAESHRRLARLVREGRVTGLRIDHIDGLWDPERYLGQLQELMGAGHNAPFYVLVEKILIDDERLFDRWLVHGTTGYEFIAHLGQLLTDSRSERRFDAIYTRFVDDRTQFDTTVQAGKRLVLEELFANALNNLATQVDDLLGCDRHWRDLTRHELLVALREIMANFGVYRTYRRPGDAAIPADVAVIRQACEAAIRQNPRRDPAAFQLLGKLLSGDYPPDHAPADYRAKALGWVMAFQQYTGAIMAKAVEDTAFYVHNRLIALNEVGGNPARFGSLPADFHRACTQRRDDSPHSMLTTSTHDTKLSEDARARLYVLSEIPEEWENWINAWRDLNAAHKTHTPAGLAPSANEECRLYQSMLAVWPTDDAITDSLRTRLREYLRKSVAEAKRNTTWLNPDEAWLAACDAFVDALLDPARSAAFLEDFRGVAGRLARIGMINSLTQVALKLTTPGMPDIYQGNEVFDFSLVDPDNRRPVDFDARQTLLQGLDERPWHDLLAYWHDGGAKMKLTRALLNFRREKPHLFQNGGYTPLEVTGRFANHVVAFSRDHEGERIIVIVPRLIAKLGCPPLGLIWDDTRVNTGANERWRDLLTGTIHPLAGEARLAEIFDQVPLAVLVRRAD